MARRIALLLTASASFACHPASPPGSAPDVDRGGRGHGLRGPTQNVYDFYNRYQWTPSYADITGFNDDQKLTMGASPVYGPRVRLYASPLLARYALSDFNSDVLVGVAEVLPNSSGPKPAAYNLKFQNVGTVALYCIYLAHSGTDVTTNWTGHVTPYDSDKGCDAPSAATQLDVDASTNSAYPADTDYAPAIRFTPDDQFNPSIAVRCATAVCELGHNAAHHRNPGYTGNNSRAWTVKTWQDEQFVAQPAGTGVSPWVDGIVAPADDLGKYHIVDFAAGYKHVAEIWLDPHGGAPPQNSVYKAWGLNSGENWVWLRRAASGEWQAAFTGANPGNPPDDNSPRFHVDRTNWSPIPVPAFARWVWSNADDLMWVSCDMGCCSVTTSGAQ